VSELLRIAWALDVAPVHLLAASFQPEDVPIQNGIRLAPSDMRAWVRGQTPIPGGDYRSYFDNISEQEWIERQERWRASKEYDPELEQVMTRPNVVDWLARQAEEWESEIEAGGDPGEDPQGRTTEVHARRKGQLEASRRARAARRPGEG
jgi:hypothetical protein